jgi:hypothetical protein
VFNSIYRQNIRSSLNHLIKKAKQAAQHTISIKVSSNIPNFTSELEN